MDWIPSWELPAIRMTASVILGLDAVPPVDSAADVELFIQMDFPLIILIIEVIEMWGLLLLIKQIAIKIKPVWSGVN
jgi:hypothetical protein